MILFFENGRLGNQLFQYCGFRKYFPDHRLYFFGCDSLVDSFGDVHATFFKRESLRPKFLFSLLVKGLRLISSIRLIGRITEVPNAQEYKILKNRGLLPGVFFAHNIYFQHRDNTDFHATPPKLKPDLLHRASNWLEHKGIVLSHQNVVFVHVRRGDYLRWPSSDYPAVLELSWYKRAMDVACEKYVDPVFVLMGDDQYYLHDVFDESERLLISDNPPEIDLAIMSLCSGGVLSASSFSWWGAYFAMVDSCSKEDRLFVAPKYWGGHRANRWYPSHFISHWITYIE